MAQSLGALSFRNLARQETLYPARLHHSIFDFYLFCAG